MKKITLSLLLLSIFYISCNVGGTWKDDNIDPKIKSQIHELNYKIIDGFKKNDVEEVLSLCSEELIKAAKNDLSLLMLRAGNNFTREDFIILNEFYQKNTSDNAQINLMTGTTGNHDYKVNFQAFNPETYVSVGFFDNDLNHTSLTLVYGKYGEEWKVNSLQVGTIKIESKDAFDWYQDAKSDYKKGYLADAANDISLASHLLKPAGPFLHYQKEKEIIQFEQKVMAEIDVKYTFPMSIDNIDTKPQIFRIYPFGMNEGYFPMIHYKTNVDIYDSTILSKECDEIHNQIGDIFYGLDKNKKMIFYRAFESIPVGNELVNSQGFIREYLE